MMNGTDRNNRGESLVEVLIAGLVISFSFWAFSKNLNSNARASALLTERLLADMAAADLAETFRSMTPEQMKTYASKISEISVPCKMIPGDFNRNGVVDGADLDLYLAERHICGNGKKFPNASNGKPCASDANLDGTVDEADLFIFQKNDGEVSVCGKPTCDAIFGDVTADGSVDPQDIKAIHDEIGKGGNSSVADVNVDGRVDQGDADLVQKILDASGGRVLSVCGRPVPRAKLSNPEPYRICAPINPPESEIKKNRMYYDPLAEMPSGTSVRGAHRSYEIQILNLRTMEARCDDEAAKVNLSDDETFVVKTQVSWGTDFNERVVLAVTLPK